MSFDLFLHRFERGEPAEADGAAVLAVLLRQARAHANAFGTFIVEFDDGSRVDLSADGLGVDAEFSGCSFHLRSFSPAVMTFVYNVAVAGGLVVINPQGDGSPGSPIALLVDERQREHLPEGLGDPPLVTSAGALATFVGADMEAWRAYRDQVVGIRGDAS